jgi:hypothetical protein
VEDVITAERPEYKNNKRFSSFFLLFFFEARNTISAQQIDLSSEDRSQHSSDGGRDSISKKSGQKAGPSRDSTTAQ